MATTAAPSANSTNSSTLSSWAGPYVTNMLGETQAYASTPYQVYGGPMTAGESGLQNKVFQGLGSLSFPSNLGQSFSSSGAYVPPQVGMDAYKQTPIGVGAPRPTYDQYKANLGPNDIAIDQRIYDAGLAGSGVYGEPSTQAPMPPSSPMDGFNAGKPTGIAAQYMNPYLESVLQPQLAEMRRQAEITNQSGLGALTKSGAFGGGRQAIMESEAGRNLLQEQNKAIGQGYANAFDKAQQQFNIEQGQSKTLADLMAGAGIQQRDIEQQGITADYNEFLAQRDYPQKMLQFKQSMLQGLPISTVTNQSAPLSGIGQLSSTIGGMGNIIESLKKFNLAG
jgi:hypothetical protein